MALVVVKIKECKIVDLAISHSLLARRCCSFQDVHEGQELGQGQNRSRDRELDRTKKQSRRALSRPRLQCARHDLHRGYTVSEDYGRGID